MLYEMDDLHVSMASGGAYLLLYSGFWDEVDRLPSGARFRADITSYSGSSAGAVVGSALSMGVPGRAIARSVQTNGLSTRFYYLRAIAVALGLKKSMYDSRPYFRRLLGLCSNRQHRAVPMTVAVTDTQMQQHSVSYQPGDVDLVNAAVASASIPYLFVPRLIGGIGLCADGSLNSCAFPQDEIVRRLSTQSGRLILLNCLPWPGFRQDIEKKKHLGMAMMLKQVDRDLYTHAMESVLDRVVKPPLTYQDGIFDFTVDNRAGKALQSPHGNLHVICVAPTHDEYLQCGGSATKAKLAYHGSDKNVVRMMQVGRQMATEYLTRYGEISW